MTEAGVVSLEAEELVTEAGVVSLEAEEEKLVTEAGVVSLETEELGAGEESVSVEEVAAVGEREEWAGMKQNYHQGGYHNNKLHGLKMFFSSFHWPTLHSITQVVPMFKVDQSKDWRLKCKQSRTSQASCSVPFLLD